MKDRKQNLVGQKFNRLEVTAFSRIRNGKTLWWCRCDCGNTIEGRADALKTGRTSSCGCYRKEKLLEYEDLSGQKFNRLLVVRVSKYRTNAGSIRWICRCDCGGKAITTGTNLKSGHAKSCGCYHREVSAKQAVRIGHLNKTHGCSGTREYQIWNHIHQRCEGTANLASNKHYYERGIRVCKRWSKFENFLADMGKKPGPEYQIDRIDTNGNYEPNNCRWVTAKEQQRNRSDNIPITYSGKTQCIAAWAEEFNLPMPVLWNRIQKMGWPIHEALTLPVAKNVVEKKRYKHLRTKADDGSLIS